MYELPRRQYQLSSLQTTKNVFYCIAPPKERRRLPKPHFPRTTRVRFIGFFFFFIVNATVNITYSSKKLSSTIKRTTRIAVQLLQVHHNKCISIGHCQKNNYPRIECVSLYVIPTRMYVPLD